MFGIDGREISGRENREDKNKRKRRIKFSLSCLLFPPLTKQKTRQAKAEKEKRKKKIASTLKWMGYKFVADNFNK